MKIYIEKNDVLYPLDVEKLVSIIDLTTVVQTNKPLLIDEIETCLDVIAEREASKSR